MCLTLNSAEEWAGSMFQAVVTGVAVAVVMAVSLLFTWLDAGDRYSLQQLFYGRMKFLKLNGYGGPAGHPY
jgi:hypothetical protein